MTKSQIGALAKLTAVSLSEAKDPNPKSQIPTLVRHASAALSMTVTQIMKTPTPNPKL